MRCNHTGLPTYCCAHCNGVGPAEVRPFRKIHDTEQEPHLFKGRDKTEWRGYGRSVQAEPSKEIASKALCFAEQSTLPKGSCVRHVGFSDWAKVNVLRSLELIRRR